jgi:hypothetical protein
MGIVAVGGDRVADGVLEALAVVFVLPAQELAARPDLITEIDEAHRHGTQTAC